MMQSVLAKALNPPQTTSLESLVGDGATKKEREYEIYGRVADLQAMIASAARAERQEQWGLPCNGGAEAGIMGNIRVRMTNTVGDDDEPVYTQTIKVKQPDDNDENEMTITEATFSMFSKLVPSGLMKTRYFFPLAGVDFELQVDVFNRPESDPCDKVKIDLEVPEGVTVEQIIIPFKLEDTRVIKPGIKTAEETEYVRTLFSKHYEFTNPLHKRK